jgi:hypothetical protein
MTCPLKWAIPSSRRPKFNNYKCQKMSKFSLKFFNDIFNIMFMFGMPIERLITLSHPTCQGMPSLTLVHNEHILVSLPFDLYLHVTLWGLC